MYSFNIIWYLSMSLRISNAIIIFSWPSNATLNNQLRHFPQTRLNFNVHNNQTLSPLVKPTAKTTRDPFVNTQMTNPVIYQIRQAPTRVKYKCSSTYWPLVNRKNTGATEYRQHSLVRGNSMFLWDHSVATSCTWSHGALECDGPHVVMLMAELRWSTSRTTQAWPGWTEYSLLDKQWLTHCLDLIPM